MEFAIKFVVTAIEPDSALTSICSIHFRKVICLCQLASATNLLSAPGNLSRKRDEDLGRTRGMELFVCCMSNLLLRPLNVDQCRF